MVMQVVDQVVVEDAFWAAVTAAVAGTGAAGRVFWDLAPSDTPVPYIVLTFAAGGADNATLAQSETYQIDVKVWSAEREDGTAYNPARDAKQIAEVVKAAMHENEDAITLASPHSIDRIMAIEAIRSQVEVERRAHYMAGHTYEIRVSREV